MREQEVAGMIQRWYHLESVVMAKIADADKMRAGKLDSAWVTAVWVGRVVKSNEHLLLTDKGLHQVQSCETHSRRQLGELPCSRTRMAVGHTQGLVQRC